MFYLLSSVLFFSLAYFSIISSRGPGSDLCFEKLSFVKERTNELSKFLTESVIDNIDRQKTCKDIYDTCLDLPYNDTRHCTFRLGCQVAIEGNWFVDEKCGLKRVYWVDHSSWIGKPDPKNEICQFSELVASEFHRVFNDIGNQEIPIIRIFLSFNSSYHLIYPARQLSRNFTGGYQISRQYKRKCPIVPTNIFEAFVYCYNPLYFNTREQPYWRAALERKKYDFTILYDSNSDNDWLFRIYRTFIKKSLNQNDRISTSTFKMENLGRRVDEDDYRFLGRDNIRKFLDFIRYEVVVDHPFSGGFSVKDLPSILDEAHEEIFHNQVNPMPKHEDFIVMFIKNGVDMSSESNKEFLEGFFVSKDDKHNEVDYRLGVIIMGTDHPNIDALCSKSRQTGGFCYVVDDSLPINSSSSYLDQVEKDLKGLLAKYHTKIEEDEWFLTLPYPDYFNTEIDHLTSTILRNYNEEDDQVLIGVELDYEVMKNDYCTEESELFMIHSSLIITWPVFSTVGIVLIVFLMVLCIFIMYEQKYCFCFHICETQMNKTIVSLIMKENRLLWISIIFVMEILIMLYVFDFVLISSLLILAILFFYVILFCCSCFVITKDKKVLMSNEEIKEFMDIVFGFGSFNVFLPDGEFAERKDRGFPVLEKEVEDEEKTTADVILDLINPSKWKKRRILKETHRIIYRPKFAIWVDMKIMDGLKGGVCGDYFVHVSPGEVVGIVGHSSAGKSTLFRVLLGEQKGNKETLIGVKLETGYFPFKPPEDYCPTLHGSPEDDDDPMKKKEDDDDDDDDEGGGGYTIHDYVRKKLFRDVSPLFKNGKVFITGTDSSGTKYVRMKNWTEDDRVHKNEENIQRIVGYVPQDDRFPTSMTVGEQLNFTCKYYGKSIEFVKCLMNLLEIESTWDQYPNKISGGQKRRFVFLRELIKQKHIYLLDETTSGLDGAAAVQMLKVIKTCARYWGVGFVMVIHQPSEEAIKYFDRMYVVLRLRGDRKKREDRLVFPQKDEYKSVHQSVYGEKIRRNLKGFRKYFWDKKLVKNNLGELGDMFVSQSDNFQFEDIRVYSAEEPGTGNSIMDAARIYNDEDDENENNADGTQQQQHPHPHPQRPQRPERKKKEDDEDRYDVSMTIGRINQNGVFRQKRFRKKTIFGRLDNARKSFKFRRPGDRSNRRAPPAPPSPAAGRTVRRDRKNSLLRNPPAPLRTAPRTTVDPVRPASRRSDIERRRRKGSLLKKAPPPLQHSNKLNRPPNIVRRRPPAAVVQQQPAMSLPPQVMERELKDLRQQPARSLGPSVPSRSYRRDDRNEQEDEYEEGGEEIVEIDVGEEEEEEEEGEGDSKSEEKLKYKKLEKLIPQFEIKTKADEVLIDDFTYKRFMSQNGDIIAVCREFVPSVLLENERLAAAQQQNDNDNLQGAGNYGAELDRLLKNPETIDPDKLIPFSERPILYFPKSKIINTDDDDCMCCCGCCCLCPIFCFMKCLIYKEVKRLWITFSRLSLEEIRDGEHMKIQLFVTILCAFIIVFVFNSVHPFEGVTNTVFERCITDLCGDLENIGQNCTSVDIMYSCSIGFHNPMFFLILILTLGIGLIGMICGTYFFSDSEKSYIVEEFRSGLNPLEYVVSKFITKIPRNVTLVMIYFSLVYYGVYFKGNFLLPFLVLLSCFYLVFTMGIVLSLGLKKNALATMFGTIFVLVMNLYSGVFITERKMIHWTSNPFTFIVCSILRYGSYSYYGFKFVYLIEMTTYNDIYKQSVKGGFIDLGYNDYKNYDFRWDIFAVDTVCFILLISFFHFFALMLFLYYYKAVWFYKVFLVRRWRICYGYLCFCCNFFCKGEKKGLRKESRSDIEDGNEEQHISEEDKNEEDDQI